MKSSMANSISNKSIFGEYGVGENQVTAALLQLLHLGGTELIGYLFEDVDLDLGVHVNTQVVKKDCHPDGEIFSNFHIYIESKITTLRQKGHDEMQLKNLVATANSEGASILYITNDKKLPKELESYSEISWMSWSDVINRLQTFTPKFNKELMAFMIEQFVLLVNNKVYGSRTIDPDKGRRVIIVPGRLGESIAAQYCVYACQPDRTFKPADYLAFYWNKRIRNVYKIVEGPTQVESIVGISKQVSHDNEPHTLFRLEPYKDENGAEVELNVRHEEPSAFTQRQRYVTIESLLSASNTQELISI